jgi:hypothetical protein
MKVSYPHSAHRALDITEMTGELHSFAKFTPRLPTDERRVDRYQMHSARN